MPETEFELPEEESLLLKDVSPQHYFYLYDGRVLKNTSDLLNALKDMSDFVFYHHVNADRNDFATWIKDVYGEYSFAHKAQQARTRLELIGILERELIKERLERANEETKEKIKISKAIVRVQKKKQAKKKAKVQPIKKAKPVQRMVQKASVQKTAIQRSVQKPVVQKLPTKQIADVQKEQLPIAKAAPELDKIKDMERQLAAKLEEVLKREKEIQIQEQKIREIETTLSKRLEHAKRGTNEQFLTREFVQGLAIGALFVAVVSIFIVRFF